MTAAFVLSIDLELQGEDRPMVPELTGLILLEHGQAGTGGRRAATWQGRAEALVARRLVGISFWADINAAVKRRMEREAAPEFRRPLYRRVFRKTGHW